MSDDRKVRLCRMHPSRDGGPIRCIGHLCGYHTASGACLIAGPNPPSQWGGRTFVIELTREQLDAGHADGTDDARDGYGEVGPANSSRERRPNLGGMDAQEIHLYMNGRDWS